MQPFPGDLAGKGLHFALQQAAAEPPEANETGPPGRGPVSHKKAQNFLPGSFADLFQVRL